MHSLRNRLIAAFLIATILPLAATIAITTSLLERSLGYATTEELDGLSRTLEDTVRQFYQREREALRQDAAMGRSAPSSYAAADVAAWPDEIRAFWDSAEPERFGVSGPEGDRLEYLRRTSGGVEVYTRDLAGIHLQELSTKLRQAREVVGSIEARDLQRGFTLTLLLLVAIVWLVSLAPLLFMAHRISKPIRQLTAGLTGFAEGDWDRRVESNRSDEVGRAVDAFNHMAEQLRRSRERLVYLTQMSSWQSLARKTAHELKNSLTPIRLTVEEMIARQPHADRAFMQEAAQIVISEIETLERRVRAFSEFAREPPVNPEAFDLNALVTERVSLLKPGHPNTTYRFTLDVRGPRGHAGADLVKGILTNLLENAADAAGAGGSIVTITPGAGRSGGGRSARLGTWHQRGGVAYAVRADHHVQEARHGAGPVDCEEECPGAGWGHHAGEGSARRRGIPGGTASGAGLAVRERFSRVRLQPDRARRMKRKHRIVVVDDEPNIGHSLRLILEGEGLRRHDLRIDRRVPAAPRPGPSRPVRAGRPASRRKRDRRAAFAEAGRGSDPGGDDLRTRDDTRRGRGDAHRGVRLPREAAGPGSRAPRHQERDRAPGSAAREPAIPRAGRRGAEDDRLERGLPPRRHPGHTGGAIGRRRAADR